MHEQADRSLTSRRTFLGQGAKGLGTAATLSLLGSWTSALGQAPETPVAAGRTPFELPRLPYPADALEPAIDAETMRIHHGRHHAGYVRKLNAAVEQAPGVASGGDLKALLRGIPTLPPAVQTSVRNNGGGHYNHALFWSTLAPAGTVTLNAQSALASALNATFGSVEAFRRAFSEQAMQVFGSGWAWLAIDARGRLFLTATQNQDNPLMQGVVSEVGEPLLGLDVWEHAYYLRYQNDRRAYVEAFWQIVNWPALEDRMLDRLPSS